MAIYKNFPKVSTLVRELRLDQKEANLIYQFNRGNCKTHQMINACEAANLKLPEHCEDTLLINPNRRKTLMEVINQLGGFHGVEYAGEHKRFGCSVYYLNSGDTYNATLSFYPHYDGTVKVTTFADIVGVVKQVNDY